MTADGQARPIDPDEAANLLSSLQDYPALGLAVSGGPDSVALMLLCARWQAAAKGRPRLVVLTVDHGLRPGSADEAAAVAAWAKTLGLSHETLHWQGNKPKANIQAAARSARYRLLADAAGRSSLAAILTAHHLDDQAETFLLRLARGSGVYGLAAMAPAETIEGVTVLRPLLTVPRARLRATLEAAGHPFFDDPSNDDARFDRARLRRLMPELADFGLTPQRLAATAARLSRAADALDAAADTLIRACGRFDTAGVVVIDPEPICAAPEEIGLRALSRLVVDLAAAPYPSRLERLEAVYGALCRGATFRRTLSGVVFNRTASGLVLYPEAGRTGFPTLTLAPGETANWHRRFELSLAADQLPVQVTALGADGWRQITDTVQTDLPRIAAITAPAFFRASRVVAVPGLDWWSADCRKGAAAARPLGRFF